MQVTARDARRPTNPEDENAANRAESGLKIVLHLSGAPESGEIARRSIPARKARSTCAGAVARNVSHRGNSGKPGWQRPAEDNRQMHPRGEERGRRQNSEGRSRKEEVRRQNSEIRSVVYLFCWSGRRASTRKEAWKLPRETSPGSWCRHILDLEPE